MLKLSHTAFTSGVLLLLSIHAPTCTNAAEEKKFNENANLQIKSSAPTQTSAGKQVSPEYKKDVSAVKSPADKVQLIARPKNTVRQEDIEKTLHAVSSRIFRSVTDGTSFFYIVEVPKDKSNAIQKQLSANPMFEQVEFSRAQSVTRH